MNIATKHHLGRFELALNVADIAASFIFYRKLGFDCISGSIAGQCITLEHGNCSITLYEGYINHNLLNFRGGDIPAIAERLAMTGLTFTRGPEADADGNRSLLLIDPDGNEIYLVYHPSEEK